MNTLFKKCLVTLGAIVVGFIAIAALSQFFYYVGGCSEAIGRPGTQCTYGEAFSYPLHWAGVLFFMAFIYLPLLLPVIAAVLVVAYFKSSKTANLDMPHAKKNKVASWSLAMLGALFLIPLAYLFMTLFGWNILWEVTRTEWACRRRGDSSCLSEIALEKKDPSFCKNEFGCLRGYAQEIKTKEECLRLKNFGDDIFAICNENINH